MDQLMTAETQLKQVEVFLLHTLLPPMSLLLLLLQGWYLHALHYWGLEVDVMLLAFLSHILWNECNASSCLKGIRSDSKLLLWWIRGRVNAVKTEHNWMTDWTDPLSCMCRDLTRNEQRKPSSRPHSIVPYTRSFGQTRGGHLTEIQWLANRQIWL